MAGYHVRANGSMGVCTAKEGNCPFGGEEGTKHFTNETEARAYSESLTRQNPRNHGLRKSSSPQDDRSAAWTTDNGEIREDVMESIADHLHDQGLIDSINTDKIGDIVLGATNGDADSTPVERIGMLAAAVSKDPDKVRSIAEKCAISKEQSNRLIAQFDVIAKVADEGTGRDAKRIQADLAWRRDGQPYYKDWERTHLDEAVYGGEPVYEPRPFGPEDLTDKELDAKRDRLARLINQLDTASYNRSAFNINADDDWMEYVEDDYRDAYDGISDMLDGVDEIQNLHYWDHEPNPHRRAFGELLQEARNSLDDASMQDDDGFFDDLQGWRERNWV